jgi:hypothetical protein
MERLRAIQRLACQTKLDKTGEVVVRAAPIAVSTDQSKESGRAFRQLPFSQQVGAFIELQANTISEALNTLRGQSNALVAQFLNLQGKETGSNQQPNGEGSTPTGNSYKRTRDPQDGDGKTADA